MVTRQSESILIESVKEPAVLDPRPQPYEASTMEKHNHQITETEVLPSRPSLPERRVTSPESSQITLPSLAKPLPTAIPSRPRNRSPYTRTHMRSRSSNSPLSAPQMTRAHSSPVPDAGRPFTAAVSVRPPSPPGVLARRRSPLRRLSDDPYPTYGGQVDIGETISEGQELELTPKPTSEVELPQTSPIHQTFPRTRRRPSSPLHQSMQISGSSPHAHALRTSTSSPSLAAAKFNEPYPSNYSYASSSIPSTPTSFRSRSPSISSLETIPDSPDAELEAENIAKLKLAADSEGDSSEGEEGVVVRKRGSLTGAMRDRKRWSVCGAERRGDLDLETIWED